MLWITNRKPFAGSAKVGVYIETSVITDTGGGCSINSFLDNLEVAISVKVGYVEVISWCCSQ